MNKTFLGGASAGVLGLAAFLALSGANPWDGYTLPALAELDNVKRTADDPTVCEGVMRFPFNFATQGDVDAANAVEPGHDLAKTAGKKYARVQFACSLLGPVVAASCTVPGEHNFPDAADNATWAAVRPADCP